MSWGVLVIGVIVGSTVVGGCAGKSMKSKVDPSFLKKVANDPFPSAAEKGVLPAPK
jgi:hypothetical protein